MKNLKIDFIECSIGDVEAHLQDLTESYSAAERDRFYYKMLIEKAEIKLKTLRDQLNEYRPSRAC